MANSSESGSFADLLSRVIERQDLRGAEVRWWLNEMIAGRMEEAEAAALLVAMRMKGETGAEIAAAASVLRDHMIRLPTGRNDVLDTCGTGGDASGTFNISTATALVTAGAGVPVVKHGNRAVSSSSGSADVLLELGVPAESGLDWARRSLDLAGLAFCFAPHFHPALKSLAGLRRRLRVRTILNCLGPLANPAETPYQLLGVGQFGLLDPLAEALAQLGIRHAFVIWSRDGLDEVSLAEPTLVREVHNREVKSLEWTAKDFGLEPCDRNDIRADGPRESANMIRGVLDGKPGPAQRVVLANTAAALVATQRVASLKEGVDQAMNSITTGQAQKVLELLRGPAET